MAIGSLGALFAGYNQSDFVIHSSLSALALVAGGWMLGMRHRRNRIANTDD